MKTFQNRVLTFVIGIIGIHLIVVVTGCGKRQSDIEAGSPDAKISTSGSHIGDTNLIYIAGKMKLIALLSTEIPDIRDHMKDGPEDYRELFAAALTRGESFRITTDRERTLLDALAYYEEALRKESECYRNAMVADPPFE